LAKRAEARAKTASAASAQGFPILKAEELRYIYPTHRVEALRGVDLNIYEGEFIAILGQNGSGKTTLAKHFNGLLKPFSGRMLVQNKPTSKYSHRELARWVGYVVVGFCSQPILDVCLKYSDRKIEDSFLCRSYRRTERARSGFW
jgi:ABC-type bacteriocin/lantibiotic exporter with double-glycine peptidase domain